MIVGIDASNVRTGGGITHLTRLLDAADPERCGIREIRVWANQNTLARLPDRPWLRRHHEPLLDRALPYRLYWQWFRLPKLVRSSCDVVFSPGGNAPPGISPIVTMCRNMLPFEYGELFRYGVSLMTLRLLLLRFGQGKTFRRADGVIFLTRYAHDTVRKKISVTGQIAIIPHGVEDRFRQRPREQHPLDQYSAASPFRILYVSIIDVYKHQSQVAEAVNMLRTEGLPLAIDFVGPPYRRALRRFQVTLDELDPRGEYLRWLGPVPFDELHALHQAADLFVFASSCENMPNILLEAMAAGFPIACSDRGPMREVLGDAGTYFDPEEPDQIAAAIRTLAVDPELRRRCASLAHDRAARFSWERCARDTLEFIQLVGEMRAKRAS